MGSKGCRYKSSSYNKCFVAALNVQGRQEDNLVKWVVLVFNCFLCGGSDDRGY